MLLAIAESILNNRKKRFLITHFYLYMYISVCACVCMHVCVLAGTSSYITAAVGRRIFLFYKHNDSAVISKIAGSQTVIAQLQVYREAIVIYELLYSFRFYRQNTFIVR